MFNEIHGMAWVWVLLLIALAHYFGDFVFQSRWVAENKGKCLNALMIHGLGYALVFIGLFFILHLLNLINEYQVILLTYDCFTSLGFPESVVQDFCFSKLFLFKMWLIFVLFNVGLHLLVDCLLE